MLIGKESPITVLIKESFGGLGNERRRKGNALGLKPVG